MIAEERIDELKQVSIVDYLQTLGYKPVKAIGAQYVYLSPLRNENTASFYVDPEKNLWNDFGGDKGDIIRLIRLLQKCSFIEAIVVLEKFKPEQTPLSFSFSGHKLEKSELQILKIKKLENKALTQYLESRNIPANLAAKFVSEAYYSLKDKQYFALAFKNDLEGYELRNKFFQGGTTPKTITTLKGANTGVLNVFEGFIDFLSALVYYDKDHLKNDVIILNSVSFVPTILPMLQQYEWINLFLDNDEAGRKAVGTIVENYSIVFNKSKIYEGYKDFNAFICRDKK